MNLLKVFILIVALAPFSSTAQEGGDLGNWLMYFGANRIHDKFSIHTEAQYRNHTVSPTNPEQLLLRTGLNYHFAKNAMVTAGYAHIGSYNFESEPLSPDVEEHRIWQQFILNNYVGRVKFEHRYRLEQRWSNNNYSNRFRYRIMLFCPLNKPKIEKGTLFLGVYDELFINAKSNFFDRNRLYGALGYQINASTGVQAGMLYQQQSNFGKAYLQFSVTFNPDLRTKS